MVNETLQLCEVAINKFLYYSQNWDNCNLEYKSLNGEIVRKCMPGFFQALHFHCSTEHMVNKFEHLYETYGCKAALAMFYFELNYQNRRELLEYILTNYNGEQRLQFGEEEK